MTHLWCVPGVIYLSKQELKPMQLIQAVRRLYKTPGQYLTLGQVVELNRRFLRGYTHFKDEPRVQKLRTDVLKYNRLIRDLGIRDHQVRLLATPNLCTNSCFPQGPTSTEGELENAWLTCLSPRAPDNLDVISFARSHT